MNCQELNQNIDDFIEDGLNTEMADAARAHVNACTGCRHRVANRLEMKKS